MLNTPNPIMPTLETTQALAREAIRLYQKYLAKNHDPQEAKDYAIGELLHCMLTGLGEPITEAVVKALRQAPNRQIPLFSRELLQIKEYGKRTLVRPLIPQPVVMKVHSDPSETKTMWGWPGHPEKGVFWWGDNAVLINDRQPFGKLESVIDGVEPTGETIPLKLIDVAAIRVVNLLDDVIKQDGWLDGPWTFAREHFIENWNLKHPDFPWGPGLWVWVARVEPA